MDQLSVPYRIALVALLVFGLAWFAVLRPKDETGTNTAAVATTATQSQPTAPGATGLGNAVDKAKGAVSASQDSATAVEQAAGQSTATGTSTQAATTSKPATTSTPAATRTTAGAGSDTDRSDRVLAAIAGGKVAVVLFSDRRAADDRYVRTVLSQLDRRGGRVAVFSAPIGEVARYAAITRGVLIEQAPSLLVIGKDKKAQTIVGFTDRAEVQQLVDDVLRRTA